MLKEEYYVSVVVKDNKCKVDKYQKKEPLPLCFIVLFLLELELAYICIAHVHDKITVHVPLKRLEVVKESIQHLLQKKENLERKRIYVIILVPAFHSLTKIW